MAKKVARKVRETEFGQTLIGLWMYPVNPGVWMQIVGSAGTDYWLLKSRDGTYAIMRLDEIAKCALYEHPQGED